MPHTKHLKPVLHIFCSALLMTNVLLPGDAVADTSPQAFGKTFGEWSARWWQWAQSIPAEINPLLDTTGGDCSVGQSGSVWFLAGTFPPLGSTAERTCALPGRKAIFFPVFNVVWVQTSWDDPTNTEEDYRAYVAGIPGNRLGGEGVTPVAGDLEARLDGAPIVFNDATPIVRTQSPLFSLATYPANSIWSNWLDVPSEIFNGGDSVSDGFWIMLPPLAPGTHLLTFRARAGASDRQNITYHLTVGH
jgi:hypothetical protein